MPETYDEAKARAARTITRTDARNPQKYQEVKAAAMKQGLPIIMVDPDASPTVETKAPVQVVYLTDHILVDRQAGRDPATYQRLRAEADRSHRTLSLVDDLLALPDEALQARVNEAISGKDPGALKATADPLATA